MAMCRKRTDERRRESHGTAQEESSSVACCLARELTCSALTRSVMELTRAVAEQRSTGTLRAGTASNRDGGIVRCEEMAIGRRNRI